MRPNSRGRRTRGDAQPAQLISLRFAVEGPLARSDVRGLCDRVSALLVAAGATIALCDVGGVDPDAVAVEALACLQLAARRHGCQISLVGASAELRQLVAFMGLEDVLPG